MTITLAARPIETRLRPLHATGFIHGFALWYSIEKLFMRSIGLNDYLITIATLGSALGFGLLRRAHGIFESSVFVAGALGVMRVTLSLIGVRRR